MARMKQIRFEFVVPAEEGLISNKVLLRAVDEKRAVMSAQTWLRLHFREYGFLRRIGSDSSELVTCFEW